MHSTIMQSLTFVKIYSVLVKSNVKVFDKPRHLINEKYVNYLAWIIFHTRVTQFILCIICLMYVATIQRLNYRGQECKTCNLQFIFLTHLWPWKKAKVIKPRKTRLNVYPKQGYIHAKFEWSCLNGVPKKANVFCCCCFRFLLFVCCFLFVCLFGGVQTRK